MRSFSFFTMPCINSSAVSAVAAKWSISFLTVSTLTVAVGMALIKPQAARQSGGLVDASKRRRLWKNLGMQDGGDGLQALQQRRRGRVEPGIGNTEHAPLADGVHFAPAALLHDFFQRHAVAGATPGGDDNVGITRQDRLGRGTLAGLAHKFAPGGLHQ